MTTATDFVFPEDFRTLRQAANEKGTSYDALRMWCRLHNVPTKRVGRSLVVRIVILKPMCHKALGM